LKSAPEVVRPSGRYTARTRPEQYPELFSRNRRAVKIPLRLLAPKRIHNLELLHRLDTLGNRVEATSFSHGDDGRDHNLALRLATQLVDERAVDL
jgi:hypothetical protein